MFITISSWCLCPLQVSTTLTQCRLNAGPTSPALASIDSTMGSALSWRQGLFTEYSVRSIQYRLNVGPASSALGKIYSTLGNASCWLRARDYIMGLHCVHTIHRYNAGSMLGQRRRRLPNTAPVIRNKWALAQFWINAGPLSVTLTYSFRCWLYLNHVNPALGNHRTDWWQLWYCTFTVCIVL